jgi:hypothetical protein
MAFGNRKMLGYFIEHNKNTAYNALYHLLDIFHLIKKLLCKTAKI